jgi:inorganic pyrophosphatase
MNYSQNVYSLESGSIDEFNVIVEIPEGSQNKYEIDPKTGLLYLDRVLYGSVFYPLTYGFIPSTLADDGDAVDVMILMTSPVPPLTVVKCRAIGIVDMVDSGDRDFKIIAVPTVDPRFDDVNDLSQIPQHKVKDIVDFFENMQKFKKGEWIKPNKTTSISGREDAIEELKKYLNNK